MPTADQPTHAQRNANAPGALNWQQIAVALALLAGFIAVPWARANADVTALTGVRLIDGKGGAPIDNATLLVENGKIIQVGAGTTVQIPASATRVDLEGKTIIPGLVNAHGHVQVERDAKLPVRDDLLRRLRTYASYGVTTVVSLGSGEVDEKAGIDLRNEQRAGRADGARLLTSGRAVSSRTPAESRTAVDRLADLGVDVIKLRLSGNDTDPDAATLKAQVDQAHARGLRTAVHIFTEAQAQFAVDAGADIIAHSVRDKDVSVAFIAGLKRRGIPYIPTLTREISVFAYETTPAFFKDPFFLRARVLYDEQVPTLVSTAYQQKVKADPNTQAIKQALVQAKRNLKRLSDGGVSIAMGTDTGAAGNPGRWQGYFEHVELEEMVSGGLTPSQALVASTRGAAEAWKLTDRGVLSAGKLADFIVLDADPLADIRNTRKINSVWLNGRKLDASGATAR